MPNSEGIVATSLRMMSLKDNDLSFPITQLERTAQERIRKGLNEAYNHRSTEKPFVVGVVDSDVREFAFKNGKSLLSNNMHMSSSKLGHAQRDSKVQRGNDVGEDALINFPINKKYMHIFYEKRSGNYIYTDGENKFVLQPNYEYKKDKYVNFITASKVNGDNFNDTNTYERVR